jgi:hypothetical protein
MSKERKSARLAFRTSRALLQAIKKEANRERTTMSSAIERILSKTLLPPVFFTNAREEVKPDTEKEELRSWEKLREEVKNGSIKSRPPRSDKIARIGNGKKGWALLFDENGH